MKKTKTKILTVLVLILLGGNLLLCQASGD